MASLQFLEFGKKFIQNFKCKKTNLEILKLFSIGLKITDSKVQWNKLEDKLQVGNSE